MVQACEISVPLYEAVQSTLGFPRGSDRKESACHAGNPGSVPGLERPMGKGMTIHIILAWEIPQTNKPVGLQSMGLQSQTRLSNEAHTHS